MAPTIRPAVDRDAAAISALMRAAILHNNARDYPSEVIERLLFWHGPGAVGSMLAKRHAILGVLHGRRDIARLLARRPRPA